MWAHNYMCQLSKVPSTYPKIPFTNTFEIRFFVSVKYDEIRCGGVVFKRGNIANISWKRKKKTLHKISVNEIVTVFKMSFTADEYCNIYLALGATENIEAFSCTDIHYAFS
jgi:hypothetical protein